MRLCSGWTMSPSPGTSGAPLLRVSPYAMNENFVTDADALSDASGVSGGSIGVTAAQAVAAGGDCTAGCCATSIAESANARQMAA